MNEARILRTIVTFISFIISVYFFSGRRVTYFLKATFESFIGCEMLRGRRFVCTHGGRVETLNQTLSRSARYANEIHQSIQLTNCPLVPMLCSNAPPLPVLSFPHVSRIHDLSDDAANLAPNEPIPFPILQILMPKFFHVTPSLGLHRFSKQRGIIIEQTEKSTKILYWKRFQQFTNIQNNDEIM